jgi:dihydroorotate dehydrogenase electron transfer subunit
MTKMVVTKILEVVHETENINTIKFEYAGKMQPGQFFMIWIAGVDEIPMSVSFLNEKIKGFTFKKIGEATNALYKFKNGMKIGVRGPYGNGFKIDGENILFVGGGTGVGMLLPAVEEAHRKNIPSSFILGAKSKKDIFFKDRLKNYNTKVYISTDDGSEGYQGYASDLAKKTINEEKFTSILTCGPEIMMKSLFEFSKKINFQASLERYMKCGVGICSQCCIGEGLRVCVEGPIFDNKTLDKIEDFGLFKRDASGRKIKL